jgi:hypothetical protein
MRIVTLDLERYGSFTDCSLKLNPAARLHVIHGLNAAGKSCALAGITDLFFGIEAQTRYSFLHEPKTMRLGATLQARDLSVLSFKRLYPFLRGLTRAVFCHAFGLNSEQLRKRCRGSVRRCMPQPPDYRASLGCGDNWKKRLQAYSSQVTALTSDALIKPPMPTLRPE